MYYKNATNRGRQKLELLKRANNCMHHNDKSGVELRKWQQTYLNILCLFKVKYSLVYFNVTGFDKWRLNCNSSASTFIISYTVLHPTAQSTQTLEQIKYQHPRTLRWAKSLLVIVFEKTKINQNSILNFIQKLSRIQKLDYSEYRKFVFFMKFNEPNNEKVI